MRTMDELGHGPGHGHGHGDMDGDQKESMHTREVSFFILASRDASGMGIRMGIRRNR